MYCKKCGSQIDDDSVFCQKCGVKQSGDVVTTETKEIPNTGKTTEQEIPDNTNTDGSAVSVKEEINSGTNRNKKKKVNWPARIIIGTILILIGVGFAFRDAILYGGLLKHDGVSVNDALSESEYRSSIESHMRDVHGVTEVYSINVHDAPDYGPSASFNVHWPVDGLYLEMPNTIQLDKKGNVVSCEWCTLGINGGQDDLTPADITNNLADADTTAVNLDDYVGKWHIDGQFYDSEYDCYETNLFIEKLGDNRVNFSIFYFRIASIESEVTFNGNEAEFICDDEYYTVGGTLTLNENSITVNITSSGHPYIPVETMTFDVRHNKICDGEGSASTPISGLPTCPRCGEPLFPETECGCIWCDICNAWMLGHGHEAGDPLVNP